jgi:hypothetical protein
VEGCGLNSPGQVEGFCEHGIESSGFIKMGSSLNSSTAKFHYQLAAQCLYLLYNAPTCFGHAFWPSSGSYKVDQHYSVYGKFS